MGNNRKLNDEEVDDSKPPPYEEINTDEFELGKSTRNSSVPINQNHASAPPLSPSHSATSRFSNYPQKDAADPFQNDFFQKPPKFLLYPSKPMAEGESGEGDDKMLENKFVDPTKQPPVVRNQQAVPAPQAFAMPQHQHNMQPNNDNGVTMSASQLTNVNAPVQGYITDNYLPRYSAKMVCPKCKVSVHSAVQYVSGQLTHLVALAAFWFTCCLVCVPYFIDDLKDAEHFCPHCMTILGYNRKKLF